MRTLHFSTVKKLPVPKGSIRTKIIAALLFLFLSASTNVFAFKDYYPYNFNGPILGGGTYCMNSGAILSAGWDFTYCDSTNASWYDLLTIEWYQSTTYTNSGGTLVQTSYSSDPFVPVSTTSYMPPTSTPGTYYYYVVVKYTQGIQGCESSDSIVTDTSEIAMVTVDNSTAPDVSNFNILSNGSICSNSQASATVTSSTLANGSYLVIYNLTGATNSMADTALLVMNNGSGSFLTDSLSGDGNETLTVMFIASGGGCYSQLNSSNTINFNIIDLSLSVKMVTYINCYGDNNGSAYAAVSGGVPPYTYSWSDSQTTDTAKHLTAGTYTVTVSDVLGSCSETASITITQPGGNIYVSAGSVKGVTCNGLSDGEATATLVGGTGPFTYSWVNSSNVVVSTLKEPDSLYAGIYTVTVWDSCGGSKSATVTITEPNPLRDSVKAYTYVGCNGGDGGSATIGGKGGNYPYNYLWSNGNTLVTASGLSAGTYSVVITDQKGCTNTVSAIIITQPNALRDSIASITYPRCNGDTGSAIIGVTGGTSPYTYSWTEGVSTSANAFHITSRTYTVTIKDANSCSSTVVFTLTQPVAIRDTIVSSSKLNVLCGGGDNGSATIGVKNGQSPFTYAWSPGGYTTATATGLTAGVYSITVTDNSGCSSSVAKVTITQPGDLRDSISTQSCSNNEIKATVGVKGGTSPYTYAWAPGGGTKATMSNLSAGIYTIVVTDKNNCSVTITPDLTCQEITEHAAQDNSTQTNCCGTMENIALYPNPSNGQFTIAGLEPGQIIELYDYSGRKITSASASDVTMQLSISNQPNGIYLIRILDMNGNFVNQKKVVKVN
jgi:hypothetical protein